MLAGIGNYLHLWQLPFIFVFFAGSVFGSGYLVHRVLRKQGFSRRLKLGRSILATFLAGLSGAFGGGVAFITVGVFLADIPGAVVGAVAAILVTGGVAYLVLYTMFNISAKKVLFAWLPAFGFTLLLGSAVAVACSVPAYFIRQKELRRNDSVINLMYIHKGYRSYMGKYRQAPKDLKELVDKKLLEASSLRSPVNTGREIGYFYLKTLPKADLELQEILACDYGDNDDGTGRAVVLVRGDCTWCPEAEFQLLLKREENAAFAKALRAAEEK